MFLNSKTHSYGNRTCVDSNQSVELFFYPLESVSQLTRAVLIQMDLIVGSENGKASSTDILNSADTLTTKKLKKSETEHLLNRLVHDKWLNEVKHRISTTFINQIELYFLCACGQKAIFLRDAWGLGQPFISVESCINLSCKSKTWIAWIQLCAYSHLRVTVCNKITCNSSNVVYTVDDKTRTLKCERLWFSEMKDVKF